MDVVAGPETSSDNDSNAASPSESSQSSSKDSHPTQESKTTSTPASVTSPIDNPNAAAHSSSIEQENTDSSPEAEIASSVTKTRATPQEVEAPAELKGSEVAAAKGGASHIEDSTGEPSGDGKKTENTPQPEEGTKKMEKEAELTIEQRAKDAAKKVAGYGEYMQLMEERVAALEAKMRTGEYINDKAKTDDPPSKRVPAVPELRRVTWTEFKNRLKSEKKIYAVEALIGKAKYYYGRYKEQTSTMKLVESKDTLASGVQPNQSSINRGLADQKEPVSRIRVNSIPVLAVLADLSGRYWTMESTVFLYPFKLLVQLDNTIRDKLVELENKWGGTDQEPPSEENIGEDNTESNPDSSPATANDPPELTTESTTKEEDPPESKGAGDGEDTASKEKSPETAKAFGAAQAKPNLDYLTDSLEALKDLRCLVEFMDQEIVPVVEKINNSSRSKIHFRDLWFLFKPGDEVFVHRLGDSVEDRAGKSSEKQQSDGTSPTHRRNERFQEDWRVIMTTHGRHNLIASNDDATLIPKDKVNPFCLLCYYIDFNGEKFVPSTHTWRIKPFEGERDITSLEVYPSKYLKNKTERRAQLKTRGEMFRNFTIFKHQHYEGPTFVCQPCGCTYLSDSIPRNTEQIDSSVVVDFREAIQKNYDWSPRLRLSTTDFATDRELEENIPLSIWKDEAQQELEESKLEIIHYDGLVDVELSQAFESSDPLLKEDEDPAFTEGTGLREEDLILLPARVLAFVFRNRKFGKLLGPSLELADIDSKPHCTSMVYGPYAVTRRGGMIYNFLMATRKC